jgi:hypothetical protein
MATISRPSTHQDKLGWYLGHCNHSVWDQFPPDEQARMVEDDLAAGTGVSLLLGALITLGMVLGAVTLAAIWLSM